ncbi:hypothetical protein RRG08_053934 [Elysia crispata]|uniref:Uncharacterized protein n=1 Tax=Elysia crispata TaxID=231223 RepID=A0AAE1DFQ7_9GAST|nr:hypothetical protein RRG08_053934 [Elysia crispata]
MLNSVELFESPALPYVGDGHDGINKSETDQETSVWTMDLKASSPALKLIQVYFKTRQNQASTRTFQLDEMDEDVCRTNFRFLNKDIPRLADALHLPKQTPCDSVLLTESGLLEELRRSAEHFCISGHQADPSRPQLISPYCSAALTPEQNSFNAAMSQLRNCIETYVEDSSGRHNPRGIQL